jgi:hypothetical protein
VAAQACHSGIGRLLQIAGGNGVYLSTVRVRAETILAKAA